MGTRGVVHKTQNAMGGRAGLWGWRAHLRSFFCAVAVLTLAGCAPRDAVPPLPEEGAPKAEWSRWCDAMETRGQRYAESDTTLSAWFARNAAWVDPPDSAFRFPIQGADGAFVDGLSQWRAEAGVVIARLQGGVPLPIDTVIGARGAVISRGAEGWEYVAHGALRRGGLTAQLPREGVSAGAWQLHGYYGPWGVASADGPRGTALWVWRRGEQHAGLLLTRGEDGRYGPVEAHGDTLILWHIPRGRAAAPALRAVDPGARTIVWRSVSAEGDDSVDSVPSPSEWLQGCPYPVSPGESRWVEGLRGWQRFDDCAPRRESSRPEEPVLLIIAPAEGLACAESAREALRGFSGRAVWPGELDSLSLSRLQPRYLLLLTEDSAAVGSLLAELSTPGRMGAHAPAVLLSRAAMRVLFGPGAPDGARSLLANTPIIVFPPCGQGPVTARDVNQSNEKDQSL